jgi:hypothetical protein
MCRPLLNLGPYLWLQFLPLLVFTGLFVLPLCSRAEAIGVVAVVVCSASYRLVCDRWAWRLVWRVRRFRTRTTSNFVLHYAPECEDHWDFAVLLGRCETDLDRLIDQFGFSLGRPIAIYLVPTCRELRTHKLAVGGFALPLANAIVVAEDTNLQETIPHELTHLFSARWNDFAPALLNEGLATCMQGGYNGVPIDVAVRLHLHNRTPRLSKLLNDGFFYSEPYRGACYVLAGSFAGFLIRRFGWERYRAFYKMASRFLLPWQFRKAFGMSLREAEIRWRSHLLALEVLTRRQRGNLIW